MLVDDSTRLRGVQRFQIDSAAKDETGQVRRDVIVHILRPHAHRNRDDLRAMFEHVGTARLEERLQIIPIRWNRTLAEDHDTRHRLWPPLELRRRPSRWSDGRRQRLTAAMWTCVLG